MKTIKDLSFGVSKEIKKYTNHSNEIAIMISNYINSKQMNKKSFAELVGKTSTDITRWVSGNHNFTILTISLIEAKTGLEIVKNLSKKEINSYRNSKVFQMKTNKEMLQEIEILKGQIEKLKSNIELSKIKMKGVYTDDSAFYVRSVLKGDEKSTLDMTSNYTRIIKGCKLFKSQILYAKA